MHETLVCSTECPGSSILYPRCRTGSRVPPGRFYSNASWQHPFPARLAPELATLCSYKLSGECPRGCWRPAGEVAVRVSSCLWSVAGLVCRGLLAVFGAAWFCIHSPSLDLGSLRWVITGPCRDLLVPFCCPLWSSFIFLVHTHTHAHWSCSLVMNRPWISMPLIRSFTHPFIQLSHRETNKCVTCQQSIISPQSEQINLSLCLLPSRPSCFPFIQRLGTHSLVSLSNLWLVQL